MVNFWSCRNAGRGEIRVIVALGRAVGQAKKIETMAHREVRVLVGKCREKISMLHGSEFRVDYAEKSGKLLNSRS